MFLAHALPAMEAEEEVCDSCTVDRSHASVSGGTNASLGGSWPRPPSRHQRNQSCPAALMHPSNSSSALDELASMEEEPSTPPAWSPALQVRRAVGLLPVRQYLLYAQSLHLPAPVSPALPAKACCTHTAVDAGAGAWGWAGAAPGCAIRTGADAVIRLSRPCKP